ncbi:hypothetical protein NUW58_g6210 [Xylaria curta]|uniref:Uncharacterized protein n=1 Tax=Xylaria curta TaxID=42375 RepID=A0ACC1NWG5_9PEZI|nr:hypothetical protein NUW58_g6210 [Xylaria curta]
MRDPNRPGRLHTYPEPDAQRTNPRLPRAFHSRARFRNCASCAPHVPLDRVARSTNRQMGRRKQGNELARTNPIGELDQWLACESYGGLCSARDRDTRHQQWLHYLGLGGWISCARTSCVRKCTNAAMGEEQGGHRGLGPKLSLVAGAALESFQPKTNVIVMVVVNAHIETGNRTIVIDQLARGLARASAFSFTPYSRRLDAMWVRLAAETSYLGRRPLDPALHSTALLVEAKWTGSEIK